jgi:excisionase family DNA binding protein
MERLLTAHELAELLNLSVETIWRYTRQGRIPVIELGSKQYRYRKDDVLGALAGSGLVREEPSYYLKQGEYTYEDYLKIPETPGYRYEIIDGVLLKEPSPSLSHQRVSGALFLQLAAFFYQYDPGCDVLCAPLDVTLGSKTVVQPDILYVSSARREILREERIDGPCDLVVEIMSPSNRRKDRLRKMEIYRRAGVRHYWLVDPEENTLEAYVLRDENYTLVYAGGPGDAFSHPEFPGLNLDLDKVFLRPESQ